LITILDEDTVVKPWLREHGINKIVIFYIVIGAIYWLTMARVVRGQVISLKHEQFVESARAIGASQGRIIFRHIVPNLMSVVIVYLTLTIPSVMLFEAFLSFLGLGVDKPGVSWGILASEGVAAINPIRIFWWLVLFPGLALASTLFALNYLGDGLRDALDPRLKNK
jgi:oligopeptide transport system permease protein